MQWRWHYEGHPGDPWANMAADTNLLSSLQEECPGLPTVRIYEWDRAAVSIGRLQKEETVRLVYSHLPIVRRPTGGRAVVHGNDLTITVAVRREWLPGAIGQPVLSSYRQIMTGLVEALKRCDLPAVYADPSRLRPRVSSVNCFETASECDLINSRTGGKLVGSAQRRERDVILQQMSLPLDILPDRAFFLTALRSGFGKALRVEEWMVN